MTPVAVLVLVVGVLVVLGVAGLALALDAGRRRPVGQVAPPAYDRAPRWFDDRPPGNRPPDHRPPDHRPPDRRPPDHRPPDRRPIDSRVARQDPPTLRTPAGRQADTTPSAGEHDRPVDQGAPGWVIPSPRPRPRPRTGPNTPGG